MTCLNDISRIDKVFGDRAPGYKTCLVRVDQRGHERLKAESKTFGGELQTAILKGDGLEVIGLGSNWLLG